MKDSVKDVLRVELLLEWLGTLLWWLQSAHWRVDSPCVEVLHIDI